MGGMGGMGGMPGMGGMGGMAGMGGMEGMGGMANVNGPGLGNMDVSVCVLVYQLIWVWLFRVIFFT